MTPVTASMPSPVYVADTAPLNLPVAKPVAEALMTAETETKKMLNELEMRAHSQHTLISSDALHVILRDIPAQADRFRELDALIAKAKAQFPSEDGWVVLNLERMATLLQAADATPVATTEIVGVGSLAEAIALGDIEAAYALIGRRPMLALADAAADFDALYRKRQGGAEEVSDLLIASLGTRSDDEIVLVVKTLTSALDGTYNTEIDAVKVAIMKAVRLLS